MHPILVISVLTGPFSFYILTIFMCQMSIIRLIESISTAFIYPMVVSILLVPKLVASVGEFVVHFRAGEVIMVMSRGGWFLIVVVKVEGG